MNFTEVASNEEFNNLELADFKEIICQDALHTKEERVFEAVISWVKSDTSKQKYLVELLKQVRMPLLPPQYLTDHVASEELIRSSLQCRDLLDEAKDYHLVPERRPQIPSFRTRQRCAIIGCIYVLGGRDESDHAVNSVEMYDPRVAKWQMGEAMTATRYGLGVAVLHNKLYAIGGYNDVGAFTTVEVFDPVLRRWSAVASMNCKRSYLGAATLFNKLYVCGGIDDWVFPLKTVESYDPEKNVWSMVTSMSTGRINPGAVAFEDHIYVLGGVGIYSLGFLNSVERYDPVTGQWTCMPPMLTKRFAFGVATLNGQIYACGGLDGCEYLRTAEVYNPVVKQWSYIASMHVARSVDALVVNCGKLFAIGGHDGTTHLSSVEVYDPELNQWDFVASLCAPARNVGAGVIPLFKKQCTQDRSVKL